MLTGCMAKGDGKQGRGRPPGLEPPKKYKQLRVERTLYERLAVVAKKNRRAKAAEGEIALENHVEAEEKRLGIQPPNGDR